MADSFKVMDQPFHVRSISLPSRPQPLSLRVEEEMNRLRTSVASSTTPEMMCNSLRGLGDLYGCIIEEFLCLPSHQQALSHPNQRKWVEEELDQSIKLLDLCSSLQDKLVAMKEHAQDLSLAFRRNDAAIESKVQSYSCSGKKVQKEIKICLKSMKQVQNKCRTTSIHEKDVEFSMVVRLLMEAKEISITLLRAVLSCLCLLKTESKESKLSFISKMLNNRKVTCEDKLQYAGEVERLEHLEVGLGCLFKQLVKTRVSLLNIISL